MKNREFSFEWEVADGYVGGSAPQYTILDPGDIDTEADLAEIKSYIEDAVQRDFDENVSASYSESDLEKMAEKLLKVVRELAAEDEVK